eukprot:CAMPEP_0117069846 /NCGR_PEP_ID=MMETSP0472-20121206/49018_1 /TAXON_ID=693140 ORGANISM="Tiarina fusus, Strain LIS" /NCGR_SAMPLE_ID=MMETSP0472 /ASSEMBLY_ACC=CAM_ASM_000603 /LENGTH=361 /DNA_ID=CAMNT_0004792607 /DNA_START=181 /DNA_END=1266 /DNA_ORIENTATION=-
MEKNTIECSEWPGRECQSSCCCNKRLGRKRRSSTTDYELERVGAKNCKYGGNEIVFQAEQDALWVGDIFGLETQQQQPQDTCYPAYVPSTVCSSSATTVNDREHLTEVVTDVLCNLDQSSVEDEEEESTWLLGECSQSFMLESESDNNIEELLLLPKAQTLPAIAEPVVIDDAMSSLCKVPATHIAYVPRPVRELDSSKQQRQQCPTGIMSDLEFFTIDSVKNCEQPALLTLTSFPFRVLYSNAAYQRMTGDGGIMGMTFYDIFVKEGKELPSFGTCPSLMRNKFQGDIVRVRSSLSESGGVYSTLQVVPVYKEAEATSSSRETSDLLRYYIVTLKQVGVPEGASIVYLPMPSGSMPTTAS